MLTTSALPLTVGSIHGESATSIASRLAMHNGAPRLTTFCSDLGISYRDLMNGNEEECRRIASLAGHDPDSTVFWTPRLLERGWFQLGNERIKFTSFNRTKMRFCPRCLAEAAHSDGPQTGHLSVWQISSIRSCEMHLCELATLPPIQLSKDTFDFARQIHHAFQYVSKDVSAESRALEEYLIRRISHNNPNLCWIDRLPFHVAAQTAEHLGVLMTLGPDVKRSNISVSEWIAAGSAGFGILSEGPEGLKRVLDAMRRGHVNDEVRYRSIYRYFFEWLRFRDEDQQFDTIRDEVREFIWMNFPVAQGAQVLGKECPRRFVHSLSTAVTTTGLTRRQLGRQLCAMGLATQNGKELGYDLLDFIPDETVQNIKFQLNNLLGLSEAAAFLGIRRFLLSKLTKPDLIERFSKDACTLPRYAPSELTRFMLRLEQLLETRRATHGWLDIATASHKIRIKTENAVSLILLHRLPLRSFHTQVSSFRDFRIEPEVLRYALKLPATGAVRLSRAAKLLNLQLESVKKLHAMQEIRSVRVAQTDANQTIKYVCPYSIDDFLVRYISLKALKLPCNFDSDNLADFKVNFGIDTEPIYRMEVRAYLQSRETG